MDGSCKQRDSEGNPTMKPHWEISQQEADACPPRPKVPVIHEYFRGGGDSSRFLTEGGVPFTMTRVTSSKAWDRHWKSRKAGAWNCRSMCMTSSSNAPTQLAVHLVCTAPHRSRAVYGCVLGMATGR
ncbi:hypothetical protein ACNKHU_16960 [Shigella flexneri]